MAYPTIETADTQSGVVTTNDSTWDLTYPTNLQAGDLILILMGVDGGGGWVSGPAGFVQTGAIEGDVRLNAAKKISDGTETGTFTVTISASEQGAWIVYRITNWGGTLGTGFGNDANSGDVVSATATGQGSANADPPILDPNNWDTPLETLWIAAIAMDTSRTVSTYPTNFPDNRTSLASGGSTGASLGVATLNDTSASINPATFVMSASDDWAAITIAIRPNSAVRVYAQAQAHIKVTNRGYAQAQAHIKTTVNAFGQAGALIGGDYTKLIDPFTRTESVGWGTATTSGGTYTPFPDPGASTDFSVNGTQGLIRVDGSVRVFTSPRTLIQPNFEMSLDVSIDKIPSTNFTRIKGQGLQGNTGTETVGWEIRLSPGGVFELFTHIAGTAANGINLGTYSVGQTWRIKMQYISVSGGQTLLRRKGWNLSGSEPAFTETLLAEVDRKPGHPRFATIVSSASNVPFTWTVDNWEVQPVGLSAFGQAQAVIDGFRYVRDTFTRSDGAIGDAEFGGTYSATVQGPHPSDEPLWSTTTSNIVSQAVPLQTESSFKFVPLRKVHLSNLDAQVDVKFAQAPLGGSHHARLVTRFSSNDVLNVNTLFAEIFINDGDNSTQLQIGHDKLNLLEASPMASTADPITFAINTYYTIRFQAINVNTTQILVRAKVWNTGSNEPDWQISSLWTPTDHTVRAGGGIGFSALNTAGGPTEFVTSTFDNLIAQTYIPAGFGQAQAKIDAVITATNVHAQAQANIKQTYSQHAQAEARIKNTYSGLGQAEARIKNTYFGLGQAQANIKQVYEGLGQAQASIKAVGNGLGQAQANIKATSNGLAQAQADIKQTYSALAQAQANIRVVADAYGQAQANIKNTYSGLAQAQADIKQTYVVHSQAQGHIKNTYSGLGQAQGTIKTTYSGLGQAQAHIKAIVSSHGQAQASIKATSSALAQAQADIKQTYNQHGQAQASIVNTYYALAQAQANILQVYSQLAQAQAHILATSNSHAQAEARIKNTYNGLGQAQADIKQTYNQHSQAQANIKAVGNGLGQAQANILQTYNQFAQAQANIKTTYTVFGQAQANIEATYNQHAQAQATILATYNQFAQAQAKINAFGVNAFAQAQGMIQGEANAFGQAQASIKATSNAFGQAQADILATYYGLAQAQADILQVYVGSGQAQAHIKNTYYGLGQSQANILSTYFGLAQAQASIKAVYNAHAQAQANILNTYNQHAQTAGQIKAIDVNAHGQALALITGAQQVFAQAQGTIKATSNSHGQAQADIKQTYTQYGQAQAHIVTTVFGHGQAEAHILTTANSFGQAQGTILATSNVHGNAQGNIKQTYTQVANAQATIEATTSVVAQAQALIQTTAYAHAQAEAFIIVGIFAHGQAQALIQTTENAFAQAQAVILKLAGYGQAQATIRQDRVLKNLRIYDVHSITLTLSDEDATEAPDENIKLGVSDQHSITLVLDDQAF